MFIRELIENGMVERTVVNMVELLQEADYLMDGEIWKLVLLFRISPFISKYKNWVLEQVLGIKEDTEVSSYIYSIMEHIARIWEGILSTDMRHCVIWCSAVILVHCIAQHGAI